MNDLYEQMNFILSGGALKLLTDFLSQRVSAALIVEPRGADLEILDAIGAKPEKLLLSQEASHVQQAFPATPPLGEVEVTQGALEGDWPWGVRMRGPHWALYILLREQADKTLLEALRPYAGLARLWHTFQRIAETEKRLARLSYMILTTKSTLASIFEPMPLDYFASFVSDVLRESLFPRSVSLFRDDGQRLIPLTGSQPAPARSGLYAQSLLTNTPVLTRSDATPYEVVLPLVEADLRLFCVIEWDEAPNNETLNFLELLGSLAARSISINRLKLQSTKVETEVISEQFSMLSLSNVLSALRKETDRARFFSLVADIFLETSQMQDCILFALDVPSGTFAPVLHRRDSIAVPIESRSAPFSRQEQNGKVEPGLYNLSPNDLDSVLQQLGLESPCPWEELKSMQYLFPFRGLSGLAGFIALGSALGPIKPSKLSALKIVAQFTGLELEKFRLR
ncbi:MAG: hypothetical protein GX256_00595 [Fretibacterium sp.]|nr:hypothetical protein [Fretibacterium sp.]